MNSLLNIFAALLSLAKEGIKSYRQRELDKKYEETRKDSNQSWVNDFGVKRVSTKSADNNSSKGTPK